MTRDQIVAVVESGRPFTIHMECHIFSLDTLPPEAPRLDDITQHSPACSRVFQIRLDCWPGLRLGCLKQTEARLSTMKSTCVFLSYVKADQAHAESLAAMLTANGSTVCNPPSAPLPPKNTLAFLREALLTATHTLVLIGPTTRQSRWVDREIELSTEVRDDGPGASLIGVILPAHADFSQPYYDPENVPLRLHDLVQNEYAIVRKWSDNPEEIRRWLEEAGCRRQSSHPQPSLRAAAAIYRFAWDETVDESRPNLETL